MMHCWMGYLEWAEMKGLVGTQYTARHEPSTCMLEVDHDGEHDWTPDKDITITFSQDWQSQ